MGMEELKSLPVDVGPRESCRLMEKARNDPAMVIDLGDDEIEEVEEWEPRFQEEVDGKHSEVEEKAMAGELVGNADNPISFWPMFMKNVETKAGLEISNGMKEALPAIGIDLNAAPQATEDDTNVSNDEKGDISRATGIDLNDSEVLDAIMDDDIMECSFGHANLQQAEVVDLSSSESGDEGDGDINGEIAERQEELVTTLSREDAVAFAEVMKAIKEGGDLRKFKVEQLKTYLRHHGLRIVGVKFVILSRIHEHQRIKDRAQEIYPRSSFSINCKGDVCLGDTVLFLQTVYDMPFDYEVRAASGPPLGKRWVAGKVLSESYGAGKQQHTFTIEVLWSTGVQPFYCMRPVKIKGRNLYRMVTMRQPWSNEAERQKVLDEKHARGEAARAIRRGVKGLKSKREIKGRLKVTPIPWTPWSRVTRYSSNDNSAKRRHPQPPSRQSSNPHCSKSSSPQQYATWDLHRAGGLSNLHCNQQPCSSTNFWKEFPHPAEGSTVACRAHSSTNKSIKWLSPSNATWEEFSHPAERVPRQQ